jgi:ABC-2 type transport system ATP-binding protein
LSRVITIAPSGDKFARESRLGGRRLSAACSLPRPLRGLDVEAYGRLVKQQQAPIWRHGGNVRSLWATHLFDEIMPDDNLVVLHRGRVLANGRVRRVLNEAGATDVNSAFMR